MDLKGYVEKIHHIEQTCDVNGYQFQGIHLWPLFRYGLLLKFRNSGKYMNGQFNVPALSTAGILRNYLKSFIPGNPEKRFLQRLRPAEAVFVDSHDKRVALGSKAYNPFLDPFIELLQELNKQVLKVHIAWAKKQDPITYQYPPVRLVKDHFYSGFLRHKATKNGNAKELQQQVEEMQRISGFRINTSHFHYLLDRVLFSKYMFDKILPVVAPKAVFFECYYKPEMFGLILSCREKRIKTVDIQHGKQGKYHIMYSHWGQIPKGGYSVLPDFFWNWGQESAHNISWSSHSNIAFHKPMAGGNLWMAKCKDQSPFILSNMQKEFVKAISAFPIRVLITLQPASLDEGGAIPEFVLKAIDEMDKGTVFWCIRMHPSEKALDEDIAWLKGRPNVNIGHATSLPLFELLKTVTHHLTKFSSVAFEAQEFDVPTIIVNHTGMELYQKQIEEQVFYKATKLEELLELLNDRNLKVNSTGYILSDIRKAKMSLNRLIQDN